MNHQQVTTTCDVFTVGESGLLAALIYKRFGFDAEAAAAAWRRMLQNSCPTQDFIDLAQTRMPLRRQDEVK